MGLANRVQVFARKNSGSSYVSGSTEVAANILTGLSDVAPVYDVAQLERNVLRPQIGQLAPLSGTQRASVAFAMELVGSGTPGVAPRIGRLLEACGFTQTINNGTAAVGTVYSMPQNTGTVVPVVTGTYGGSKSGRVLVTVQSVVSNTSVFGMAIFYPGDGTTPGSVTFTQNSGTASSISSAVSGLSVDFGDPSSSTAGIAVGDQFWFTVTSADEVSVTYRLNDSPTDKLDLAVNRDGNLHRFFGAMGNLTLNAAVGQIVRAQFEFQAVPAGRTTLAFVTSSIPAAEATPEDFKGIVAEYDGNTPACTANWNLSLNNNVILRQCANNATGFEQAIITSRAPQLTYDPLEQAFNTFDPFSDLFGDDTRVVSYQWGSTGNKITISARYAKTTAVTNAERDGETMNEITLNLAQPEQDGSAEYHELEIKFE